MCTLIGQKAIFDESIKHARADFSKLNRTFHWFLLLLFYNSIKKQFSCVWYSDQNTCDVERTLKKL